MHTQRDLHNDNAHWYNTILYEVVLRILVTSWLHYFLLITAVLFFFPCSFPCMCVSAKADIASEPIYLSKEEVGEILVREMERRRFRASAEINSLSQLKTTVPLKTAHSDRTCPKYQDALHRQLKAFSERCNNSWESVDIPDSRDDKPKKQTLNCQPIITASCGQQDSRMKMAKEPVSCSNSTPGGTSVSAMDNTSITAGCIPKARENRQSSVEAGCHISLVDADRCTVQPCSNKLEADVRAPSASSEAVLTVKKKKKKTVTFSDNVELVASAGDVADPVDYMSYVASIGRQANSSCAAGMDPLPSTMNGIDTPSNCSRDCDAVTASDSSDETDIGNSVTSTGQVRCSLCRQKWVALTDTYCSDCSFYLSKLELSN